MNQEAIMTILPHRGPMLLLDEARLDADGTAYGTYHVRGDEWFLNGHFPGDPVMPGVVQCEIIAQTSCILLQEQIKGKTAYYAGIDKARFRRVIRPGDTVQVHVSLIRQKLNVFVVKGETMVDGETCAVGEFSFIIPS